MVEIYNEEIRDLLALPGAAVDDAKHEIRHEKDGTTTITGVASVVVDSVASVEALLSRAAASRSTGATASNAVSSRSHSVFVLRVAMRHPATAQTRHGVLNLIDLAGSEVSSLFCYRAFYFVRVHSNLPCCSASQRAA